MKTLLLSILVLFSVQSKALTFDSDVPDAIKQQFQVDYDLVTSVQAKSATALHQKIFGPVAGATYKNFFESRVKQVGMDSCGGGSGVVACVQPFIDSNVMWLSPNFVKFNMPQIARIMVLFHEARHTESKNGHWGHDSCPVPFRDEKGQDIRGLFSGTKLEGLPACDSTVYGSYGSSTIMIKNIAKFCQNCSEKTVMDAEMMVSDQVKRITDAGSQKQMRADFATK